MIDHQLELSREIAFNRLGDSLGGFACFGEYKEVVSVTHEVEPRDSSSLSKSSRRMFAKIGESGPPCIVPSIEGCSSRSTITPARRQRPISFSNCRSCTFRATRTIKISCWTRSKNLERSISMHWRDTHSSSRICRLAKEPIPEPAKVLESRSAV